MTTEDTRAQASQKLKGIIEEALRYGADGVELEYADGGLEISYMVRQGGLGHVLTDRMLVRALLGLIIELAGLEKKSRGVMAWTQAGQTWTVPADWFVPMSAAGVRPETGSGEGSNTLLHAARVDRR